jgi:hypothetical protein
MRGGQVFAFFGSECVHQLRGGHVLGSDWSLDGLSLPFMLGWVVFVLRFIEQLHAVRSGPVFRFFCVECVHQLRGGLVLGSDWSLDGLSLPFMLGWVVFVLRFIEQLHAVRSGQVLKHLGRIHLRAMFGVIWQILPVWLNLTHRLTVSYGLPLSGWNR